ncbi:MAG: hypothetical protein SR3Q1_00980 [Quinella sp. 3Q1]|nr:hypothetical protein [Quinella sp. 3Q1]
MLPVLVSLAQLIDAYVRFLPLNNHVSERSKRKIFIGSAIWCVVSIFLYFFIFKACGVNAVTYKSIIMLGWLPYFIINVVFLSDNLPQNVFVLGMAAILALFQHTLATNIVLSNFQTDFDIIFYEAMLYLALFAVSLPLLRKLFLGLLPSREFFNLRPQGWYIALLPLIIVLGHIIRIADGTLIHSFYERLSRIYLPIVFFIFYRFILSAAENFYDLRRLERNKSLLQGKLTTLKDYNALILENQTQISVMRHDLRHSYNIIYTLLENNEIEKALEHIKIQKRELEEQKN